MNIFNKETDSSDTDAPFPDEFNAPLPMPVDDDVNPSPLGLPGYYWMHNIDTTTDKDDVPAIPEKKTRKRKDMKPNDDELDETESESSVESDEFNGDSKKNSNGWRWNMLLQEPLSDSSDEEHMDWRDMKPLKKARAKEQEFDITNKQDRPFKDNVTPPVNQVVPGTSLVTEELVLDFDKTTKRPLLKVAPNIVKKLKPHQVKGVKFMWDACFESLERMKNHPGSGCILAHCMGLGKTFQVVALVHTLLSNPATEIKTVLIVCPLSTMHNWVSEFSMWLKDTQEKRIRVIEMSKVKSTPARKIMLEQWQKEGGVMVMSYDNYRNLSSDQADQGKNNHPISDEIASAFNRALVNPGPDVVVFDEGHLLKNEDTKTSKAVSNIRTPRRILLTGTPLQNNLKEYHCMVNLVKPNLLGDAKEFVKQFVNPICKGQFENSTPQDVKVMKRRSHVLHKMLDGAIQRFDYRVLTPYLPPKLEYMISIRLSEVQTNIYQQYLEQRPGPAPRKGSVPDLESHSGKSLIGNGGRKNGLFSDWNYLQRIGTHPKCLLGKFSVELDGDSDGSLGDLDSDGEDKTYKENAPKRPRVDGPEIPTPSMPSRPHTLEWWKAYVTDDDLENMASSGKLQFLFTVLTMAKEIGDKVLVFSQSLGTLQLIEYFLARIDRDTRRAMHSADHVADPLLCGNHGTWTKGKDYFRLDGSANVDARRRDVEDFNDPENKSARLFLISTKAGGLGINLIAANRVIIFDASWNPSHDVQSLFRVYRFGQKKPCYIYRLVAYGTMEEKVYDRQVTKLSLACRVVDEQQIGRHYSTTDLLGLYKFEPRPAGDRQTPILPKDRLLADLMNASPDLFETYHEHDSLLVNVAEEELNEEERKAAWEDYETEKKGPVHIEELQVPINMKNLGRVRESIENKYPRLSDDQLETFLLALMVNALEQNTGNMPSTSAMPNSIAVPENRPDPIRVMSENSVKQKKVQEMSAPVASTSCSTVTVLNANMAQRTFMNPITSVGTVPGILPQNPGIEVRSMANVMNARPNFVPMPPWPNLVSTQTRLALKPGLTLYPMQVMSENSVKQKKVQEMSAPVASTSCSTATVLNANMAQRTFMNPITSVGTVPGTSPQNPGIKVMSENSVKQKKVQEMSAPVASTSCSTATVLNANMAQRTFMNPITSVGTVPGILPQNPGIKVRSMANVMNSRPNFVPMPPRPNLVSTQTRLALKPGLTLYPMQVMSENSVKQKKVQEMSAPVASTSCSTVTVLNANMAQRTFMNPITSVETVPGISPQNLGIKVMSENSVKQKKVQEMSAPVASTSCSTATVLNANMAQRTFMYPITSVGTVPGISPQNPGIKVRSMANVMESRPSSVPMQPMPNLASTQTRLALQPGLILYPLQIRQNLTSTHTGRYVPIQPRNLVPILPWQYPIPRMPIRPDTPIQKGESKDEAKPAATAKYCHRI